MNIDEMVTAVQSGLLPDSVFSQAIGEISKPQFRKITNLASTFDGTVTRSSATEAEVSFDDKEGAKLFAKEASEYWTTASPVSSKDKWVVVVKENS